MIDASFNGLLQFTGKAYLFKGDRYVRYDWAQDKVEFGPVPIVGNWHGIERLGFP